MIESGSFDKADLFITPPSGDVTDEDSGDEDAGGLVDNLSRRQLQAECEAVVSTAEHEEIRIGSTSDIDSEEEMTVDTGDESMHNDSVSTSGEAGVGCDLVQPSRKRRRAGSQERTEVHGSAAVQRDVSKVSNNKTTIRKQERKWTKTDLPDSQKTTFDPPKKAVLQEFSPVLFFEQFFGDDIIQLMREQSIVYARSKGNHRFSVDESEVRAFLAILTVSSYVPLPRRRMFWEQTSDVHNEVVTSFMARDRFEEIMRYVNFAGLLTTQSWISRTSTPSSDHCLST